MTIRECTVDGCEKIVKNRRMCTMHNKRLRLYGDTSIVHQRGGHTKSSPEDFWNRLDKSDGCWEWTGALGGTAPWQYGSLSYQGKQWKAHRLAFYLHHGKEAGNMVCHHCDNPKCCNPEHLYDGTPSRNLQDAYDRDRKNQPKGAEHVNAKLTKEQEKELTEKYISLGTPGRWSSLGGVNGLAEEYGIHRETVRRIVRRNT